MDYIQLTGQKFAFLIFVGALIATSVLATFAYKNEHYGNATLPDVFATGLEKRVSEMYYRAVFSSGSLAAVFISAVTGEGRETYSRRKAQAIPALLYHGISEEDGEHLISEAEFADHMRTLYAAGWRTITLEEFEQFLRGNIELPERSFLLTFDDGAKISYYPVDPILAALDMTAATFILPKYSIAGGSYYYLSMGEINSMIRSGRWEIGSHSQNGHDMIRIDERGNQGAALANRMWSEDTGLLESTAVYSDRVQADLRISRHNLERSLGIPIASFAFPFGEFGQAPVNYLESQDVLRNVAEEVYDLSFYQSRGGEGFPYNYPDTSLADPLKMVFAKRIEPTSEMKGGDVLKRLEDGLPKDLPFEDGFNEERGWLSAWGPFTFSGSGLELASLPEETGSAIVLDGSAAWQDYRFTASVDSPRGTGVYLWIRYRDNKTHAGCNFGNGFIHVEETTDHVTRVIKGIRSENIIIPDGVFTAEARVEGRSLTCTLGAATVTSEFLDPTLDRGGIGIKIWEPTYGTARLTVQQISVEALPDSPTTADAP